MKNLKLKTGRVFSSTRCYDIC